MLPSADFPTVSATPQPASGTAIQSQPRFQRVRVIVNPSAGQDEPILNTLNTTFRAAGVDWDILITKEAGDGRRLTEEALAAGADVIAAYGGDGTVMEVASVLAGTHIPLAILPGGTANVIAAELGVPPDLAGALALINHEAAVIQAMDVGQVGEYRFLTRIGMGLEVAVIEETDREAKSRLGWLAYALTLLQKLTDPPVARYRLLIDGREIEAEGLMCVVANSGTFSPNTGVAGRPLSLGPEVSVNDGLLDVVVIRRSNLASLLSVAASLVAGNDKAEPLERWPAREVTVMSDPPQGVQCDGEIIGMTPVTARVAPQALRVIVPPPVPTPR